MILEECNKEYVGKLFYRDGKEDGRSEMIYSLIRDGKISAETGAEYLNTTADRPLKDMQKEQT